MAPSLTLAARLGVTVLPVGLPTGSGRPRGGLLPPRARPVGGSAQLAGDVTLTLFDQVIRVKDEQVVRTQLHSRLAVRSARNQAQGQTSDLYRELRAFLQEVPRVFPRPIP